VHARSQHIEVIIPTHPLPSQDDDYDPLEAFMSEIHEEVAANKPAPPGARPDAALACDDEADPAAEYMAVGGLEFFGELVKGMVWIG
jgi:hypothetical protein